MSFQGKITLITRAGIGEATALALAAKGTTVLLAGRTSVPLAQIIHRAGNFRLAKVA
jgi:NADP-dependent 3-hydroxy acid dehydrogenase YdfG